MRNEKFLEIKEKILNNVAISFEDYNSLTNLKEEFKAAMTSLSVGWDVRQSLFMREKMLEIISLLEKAKTE